MMVITQVDVQEAINDAVFIEVLRNVIPDGVSIDTAVEYIKGNNQMFKMCVNETVIGYFTKEKSDVDGCIECHAYVHPTSRKYSVRALKAIVDDVRKSGHYVKTSVLGNFPHVLRVLGSIGFTVVMVEDSAFMRDGVLYPIFHLTNNLPNRV